MRNVISYVLAFIMLTSHASAQVGPGPIVPASGTYTPVFSFGTPGDLSVAYTIQTGEYTKIGNLVCVAGAMAWTPTFTTATGTATFSLPITPGGQTGYLHVDFLTNPTAWNIGTTQAFGRTQAASFSMRSQGSTVADTGFGQLNFVTATAYSVRFSGCYFTS